jgi:hypothetical protein
MFTESMWRLGRVVMTVRWGAGSWSAARSLSTGQAAPAPAVARRDHLEHREDSRKKHQTGNHGLVDDAHAAEHARTVAPGARSWLSALRA